MNTGLRSFVIAASLLCVPALQASTDWAKTPAPYAKKLVERVVATQPDMLDVIFHVTPPNTTENYAVAAHTASEQGSKSGADDLAVMVDGKPVVEVQKDGVRIGVLLPLHDKSSHTIGTVGMMYKYHTGDDQNAFLARSEKLRDQLARQIPSRESLFDKTR